MGLGQPQSNNLASQEDLDDIFGVPTPVVEAPVSVDPANANLASQQDLDNIFNTAATPGFGNRSFLPVRSQDQVIEDALVKPDFKGTAEQTSLGFQEGMQKIGSLTGLDRSKELESLARESPPQTTAQANARLLGEFFPGGPIAPGVLVKGANTLGPLIASKAAATGQSASNIVSGVGKVLASLKGKGYNEKIVPLIKESPELVFKPKKGWQAIHNGVFNFIKSKKKDLGEKLGAVKKNISGLIKDNVIDSENVLSEMSQFDKNFVEGTTSETTFNQIKNLVSSGGKSIKNPKPKIVPITDPAIIKKRLLAGAKPKDMVDEVVESVPLNIDNMEKIVRGIEDTPAFEAIRNKSAKEASFDLSPSEFELLDVRSFIKKKMDDLINTVDDVAQKEGLISAKGEYAQLANQNRIIGGSSGISSKQVAANLKRSLSADNENEFDAFRAMLPKKMYDEAISSILNQVGSVKFEKETASLFTEFGFLRKLGQQVGRSIEAVGGVTAGGIPKSPIGTFPTALIEARLGLQQGAAKGLNSAVKATRIMSRNKIVRGLAQGAAAELEEPTPGLL